MTDRDAFDRGIGAGDIEHRSGVEGLRIA